LSGGNLAIYFVAPHGYTQLSWLKYRPLILTLAVLVAAGPGFTFLSGDIADWVRKVKVSPMQAK
jgi:hypothetical protein